jgi:hypothetical protein
MVASITRLRIRRWWHFPAFVLTSLRAARQAASSEGNVAVRLLRDRDRVFWTATAWTSEGAVKRFMHAPPHGPAMRKLLDWCDEASLVHWLQETGDLPSWDEAHRRLQQEGRLSKVKYPSDAQTAFRIPPPIATARATTRLK